MNILQWFENLGTSLRCKIMRCDLMDNYTDKGFWDCSCSCGESLECVDPQYVFKFDKKHESKGHQTSLGLNERWKLVT